MEQTLATDMADPYAYYVDNELKSHYWVATSSGQVVGTAAVYPAHDEPGVGEVFRVSVDERFRGSRIATTLMDRVEEWSVQQGYVQLMLSTTDYLHEAHRLYEGRGYEVARSFQFGSLSAREYRKSLV
jgi:GNAT superfamily N-acetyltransferase